jgi:hypothetical protein
MRQCQIRPDLSVRWCKVRLRMPSRIVRAVQLEGHAPGVLGESAKLKACSLDPRRPEGVTRLRSIPSLDTPLTGP